MRRDGLMHALHSHCAQSEMGTLETSALDISMPRRLRKQSLGQRGLYKVWAMGTTYPRRTRIRNVAVCLTEDY